MFKKLYSEANDEIAVNTELKEHLKQQAANSRAKKRYSFIYNYGYVAAALIIVAVSINVFSDAYKGMNGLENNIVTEDKKDEEVLKARMMPETANVQTEDVLEQRNEAVVTKKETKVKEKAKSESVEENAKTNSLSTDVSGTVVYDAMSEADIEPRASGGGGGNSYEDIEVYYSDIEEYSNMQTAEYLTYLGISDIYIPEGLELLEEDNISKETDNTIIYKNNNQQIEVNIIRENVMKLFNSSHGESFGNNCKVIFEGDDASVYILKDSFGIIINTHSVLKEDVFKIINSVI